MSQPSLGPDEPHVNDRLMTPPLSPMYLGDGQSHVPSSKTSKMQISCYQKPAAFTTASMETHWEETVLPDNKQQPTPISVKSQQANPDADETESELIAIPESDLSDSTLYDSNQVVI